MATKKNDFDQDSYVQKVDSAHNKLGALESRIDKIEELTNEGIILKTFKKDVELRNEFESLIWNTLVSKAWLGFLYILGATIIIPIVSKLFAYVMLKFGVTF